MYVLKQVKAQTANSDFKKRDRKLFEIILLAALDLLLLFSLLYFLHFL